MSHEDMDTLEKILEDLEGTVSNVLVPFQAHDIGDVDERPTPRACDLGYPEAVGSLSRDHIGNDRFALCDESNVAESHGAYIAARGDAFIDDVTEWA